MVTEACPSISLTTVTGTPCFCLGSAESALIVDVLECCLHREIPFRELHILPAQARQFAFTYAGKQRQRVKSFVTCLLYRLAA